MTDRDKLADIIDSFFGVDSAYFGVDKYEFADHLLANGVIVPPCKIGEKAYTIDNREITITDITVVVDRYEPPYYKFDCQYKINNGIYPYFFNGYEIGKTVFLTKEEAEEKLKELK